MDRYDAVLVEPHAAEDEAEELALRGGVGLGGPEHGEVLEHLVLVTNAERDEAARDYLKAIETHRPTIDLWDRERLVDVAQRTARAGLLDEDITFHPVSDVITTHLADDARMALALVSAAELVRLPGIENLTVFDLNVRLGLGNTKINRELRNTIQRPDEHQSFPAYHNGLTLLTNRLGVDEEGLSLEGVGVVNGCQSLLSLWRERGSITPQLNLMVKVVETGGRAALADRITYRSNNQNPVNTRDLRANDRVQLLEDPSAWLPAQRDDIAKQLETYVDFVVDETNYFVSDREEQRQQNPDAEPFDPKTIFKASTGVRPIGAPGDPGREGACPAGR